MTVENDRRPAELVLEHYEVEKELADRLRNSTKAERSTLYTEVYEELYRRVPHHQQLTTKVSPELQKATVLRQRLLLDRFLTKDKAFLEIGPGDCSLVFDLCDSVELAYGVDVSETITKSDDPPGNFELVISNGSDIPVPAESIDVAYSNQLMEHLHPEDAVDQLESVYASLSPGGRYICITPSRLNGPHDVSRDFDTVATGFHLKEYTVKELVNLFKSVGFGKVQMFIGFGSRFFLVPVHATIVLERLVDWLPGRIRRKIAGARVIRNILYPRIVGNKT
jgi:SAM-dependent methyltransferase